MNDQAVSADTHRRCTEDRFSTPAVSIGNTGTVTCGEACTAQHIARVRLDADDCLVPLEGATEEDFLHWGIQKDGYNVEAMLERGELGLVRGNIKYRHERRK